MLLRKRPTLQMSLIHSGKSFIESFCIGYVKIKLNQHLIQPIFKNIPAN